MSTKFKYPRFDGIGDSREERVQTLENKIADAELHGHHDKLENLRRIYHYELICLQLNQ